MYFAGQITSHSLSQYSCLCIQNLYSSKTENTSAIQIKDPIIQALLNANGKGSVIRLWEDSRMGKAEEIVLYLLGISKFYSYIFLGLECKKMKKEVQG